MFYSTHTYVCMHFILDIRYISFKGDFNIHIKIKKYIFFKGEKVERKKEKNMNMEEELGEWEKIIKEKGRVRWDKAKRENMGKRKQ